MKEIFEKYNIDVFGVTSADKYNAHAKTHYTRCIVALFPYFCGYPDDSNLSIYTHGRDYHKVIFDILSKVALELKLKEFDIRVDTGPEIERSLAQDAGLCFPGRNGMAINDKYGSYFFIGYIACMGDYPLDKPLNKTCINCGKCISACPGGALKDSFKEERCLSAITQKKGALSPFEEKLIYENRMVFGCDICQKVCPHNKDAEKTPIDEFSKNRILKLKSSDIEGLSNKQFKEKFENRAFSWRGKEILKRNLKIIGH